MSEDSIMENKNQRTCSAPTSEAKSNKSDSNNVVGKLPHRGGKKRDGGSAAQWASAGSASGSSSFPFKNQKPIQSRFKGSDKKYLSRSDGSYNPGTHRKNDHQINDSYDPDLESILSETGKKQNLAHLLNMKFQLAPRESASSPYWRATHTGNGPRSRYGNSHLGRYFTKDHYLQANCQFVVKAGGDYTVYLADPDLLVPWESIEQIRMWDSEVASCPICLHPPVAARMTRCGHIYCWPCILHFLALSDKPSRPCPICDASIKIQDLKSVLALEQRDLKIGDVVEMRLMKRDRHSLIPQPVHHSASAQSSGQQKLAYLSSAGANQVFSKLLLCTPNEVVNEILRSERLELTKQFDDEKDCPESCFIQQALKLLETREAEAVSNAGVYLAVDVNELKVEEKDEASADVRSWYTSTSSDGLNDHYGVCEGRDTASPSSFDESSNVLPVHGRNPQQQKNVFYFYQSSDGQATFLHSLNVSMLVKNYGSLELCPEVIEGRIAEVESLSMNEELRNRLRYLGHIPISKSFQIVEISLDEQIVDPTILDEYRDRIADRDRRRRRKDREERRRDLEIQRAEEAKWGRSQNKPIAQINSQIHFPEFSPPSLEYDPSVHFPTTEFPPQDIETSKAEHNCHGPSFAQMLREGKNKPPIAWPKVTKNTQPLSTPTRLPLSRRSESETEVQTEEYAAPEFRDTFSSAFAAAFDQAAKSKDGTEVNDKQSKKGRKKVKQKVLFTTSMNFM